MKTLNESEAKVKEVLRDLESSPVMEQIRKEKAEKVLGERLVACAKLREVVAKMEAGFPELEASLESILNDIKEAEESVVRLRAEAGQTKLELTIWRGDLDWEKSAQEKVLME